MVLNIIAKLLQKRSVCQKKKWNDLNEINTDIHNTIIPTNLTKVISKNKTHDPNNNLSCNHNQLINIDITTKLDNN